jgi:LytS/YehU family sensor histidine kinase
MHESTSKAEDMMLSLSDLFRYSINRKGKKLSTIADEVEMVENYLKIEKIRFEERLKFTIDVNNTLLEREIPMYILQPLIENAVKHGISNIKDSGEIHLKIKEEKNNLVISVSDNGVAFPEDMYSGYGLQSIYDLLRLSYGDKASLNWTNTPKKSITILIPSLL